MKFLCDQCKRKYQISDDKVVGKTIRMKCRFCGHLIEVRAEATDQAPQANAAGLGGPAAPVAAAPRSSLAAGLATAPKKPVASPKPSALSGALQRASQEEESALEILQASSSVDWYAAIAGVPVGPIRISELRAKAAQGLVNEDTLVWQEGLEEWRPVRAMPELASLLREAALNERPSIGTPAPPKQSRPPPPPARRSSIPPKPAPPRTVRSVTPAPASAAPKEEPRPQATTPSIDLENAFSDDLDFDRTSIVPQKEGRAVRPAAQPLAASAQIGKAHAGNGHVGNGHAGNGHAAGAQLVGTAEAHRDPFRLSLAPQASPRIDSELPDRLPLGIPAGVGTPGITNGNTPAIATLSESRASIPPSAKQDQSKLIILLGMLGVTVFGAVSAYALFFQKPQIIRVVEPGATVTVTVTAPTPTVAAVAPVETVATAEPSAKQGVRLTRNTAVTPKASANVSSGPDPNIGSLLGTGPSGPGPGGASVGSSGGGSSLTADQIQATVGRYQLGIKRSCWERQSGTVSAANIKIKLNVNGRGGVDSSELAESNDPVVGKCIEAQVRSWQFPATGGATT
ncbi:MAG: zinc-ribbon domain-containing protein, partial [Polyangiaceae bacterium]|nr:zinc-ribbon domain-containing protein [Polyangiaceae bacterium]